MTRKKFLLKLITKITNSVMGAGLVSGFMTASTGGLGYFFVVASFLKKKDMQRRVAAMTGFLMGQFVMFTSIYARRLHQVLVQPHNLIMLFLSSFFVQLFWTDLQILRNTQDPENPMIQSMRRMRVLRLQLEFLLNFFVQLCNPYLEPGSMVPRLVSIFLLRYQNETKLIFFVMTSLVGWLISHMFLMILFMKLLQFVIHCVRIIMDWIHNNFDFDES